MHALLNHGVAPAGRPHPNPVGRQSASHVEIVPHPGVALLPPQESVMRDADFFALQIAFLPSGGLVHGEELAQRLHLDGAGGFARLARWIVGRQAFSFSWHAHFWLPMFQFDASDMTPCHRLQPVLSELADVMDGWALANWFTQPNDVLEGRSPVAMWPDHGPDVHQAARLQRFVMTG